MRVAIIQSVYVPWKGFFDMLNRCDVYVIYDSSEYSKGHWHNRNRIKRAAGSPWITIPVKTSGRLGQSIDDVEVSGAWAEKHWTLLTESYHNTRFFAAESKELKSTFEAVSSERYLSVINATFLRFIAARLGLKTRIVVDREFTFGGERTDRLVQICSALGATRYLSGPAAKTYLNEDLFTEAKISVEWMSYGRYATYPQPHGEFEHGVSVIDTLFCCGHEATAAMIAGK